MSNSLEQKVVMSPNNGALCIAISLYTRHVESMEVMGHNVTSEYFQTAPTAYVMDIGVEGLQMFSAEWVHNNLEILGDL
jgi:hypothetical protein